MLKELAKAGLVEQSPQTRRYRLGWNLRVLAAGSGDTLLVQAAKPMLQQLVASTGEVALLSVQEGRHCLTVLREESAHSLRAGGWVGRRSPLHCTASGRALLYASSDDHVELMTAEDLDSSRMNPRGPENLDSLLETLRVERARGYSIASEEVEVGLTSVAAPVRSPAGDLVGVINVSAPTSRIISKCDKIGKLLVSTSGVITRRMSFQ
ncbi:IclR family transcriptional regulator [Rothia sp. AR01]|uniref:IclR family transcriptional regulator n=2 Tax=Rothia santali TaxID=2949643 RepID=A0A9X2HBM1_9MICC|nr:IclR family transcriptional regulator [Rothia santali]